MPHAQPIGQRGEDLQRLAGNCPAAFWWQGVKRAHVVQPVGQLDDHDPDVLRHREEHLAQAFRLMLAARFLTVLAEPVNSFLLDLLQFGHAVHQAGYFGAEIFLQ